MNEIDRYKVQIVDKKQNNDEMQSQLLLLLVLTYNEAVPNGRCNQPQRIFQRENNYTHEFDNKPIERVEGDEEKKKKGDVKIGIERDRNISINNLQWMWFIVPVAWQTTQ